MLGDPWGHADPYDLQALDTRVLLKYLRIASNMLHQIESFERKLGRQTARVDLERKIGFDPMEFTRMGTPRIITIAQIKDELARRPHIMRRIQGAAARRARALKRHGKGKSRDR